MSAYLVTLTQAKGHLLIPVIVDDPRDPDLQLKLDAAEAAILTWLNSRTESQDVITAWTAETVPPDVRAAILLQVGELWRFRGDDVDGQTPPRDTTGGDLSPAIVALLRRWRLPVIA